MFKAKLDATLASMFDCKVTEVYEDNIHLTLEVGYILDTVNINVSNETWINFKVLGKVVINSNKCDNKYGYLSTKLKVVNSKENDEILQFESINSLEDKIVRHTTVLLTKDFRFVYKTDFNKTIEKIEEVQFG